MTLELDSSMFCRGANGTCECECFCPQADGGLHCWKCKHGISKHPGATLSNKPPSNPPLPVAPSQPRTTSGSEPTGTGNATSSILGIFRSVAGHNLKQGRPPTRNGMDEIEKPLALASTATARAEVLASFGSKKQVEYSRLAKWPTAATVTVQTGSRKVMFCFISAVTQMDSLDYTGPCIDPGIKHRSFYNLRFALRLC